MTDTMARFKMHYGCKAIDPYKVLYQSKSGNAQDKPAVTLLTIQKIDKPKLLIVTFIKTFIWAAALMIGLIVGVSIICLGVSFAFNGLGFPLDSTGMFVLVAIVTTGAAAGLIAVSFID